MKYQRSYLEICRRAEGTLNKALSWGHKPCMPCMSGFLDLPPGLVIHQDSRLLQSRLQFIIVKDRWQNQQREKSHGVNSGNPHITLPRVLSQRSCPRQLLNSSHSVLGQRVLRMLMRDSLPRAVMGGRLCGYPSSRLPEGNWGGGVSINPMVGTNHVGTVDHSYI